MTTSTAGICSSACMSIGIPRPSSSTEHEPSLPKTTVILVAWPGQRFVDGVVDGFVDQLVEAPLGRVADVHAGPLADGLEALENFDLLAGVFVHSHRYFAPYGVLSAL